MGFFVGFFFPFKSCCCYCRCSRRCRTESKHAFIFCLSFYLQGDIQCQRLPFDRRQSPAGQKTFFKTWGEGKEEPPRPRMLGFPFLTRPDPKPTRPTAHPWKTIFPSTHQAQAEKRHPYSEEHPPRARHSCCRLALADLHLSVAFPVCRPLTTGAIFVSQRCSLKPFKNGEGAGKKKRERQKRPSPYKRGFLDTSGNLRGGAGIWPTRVV